MAKASSSAELPVPAKTVWAVVGNFNSLPDWHPAVQKSELVEQGGGTVRKLSLMGGGTIEEKLEQIDDSERRYTYSIVSGPPPVTDYRSTLSVRNGGDGRSCTIEWLSEFEAEGAPESAAVQAVSQIYEAGFENLKKMFGG